MTFMTRDGVDASRRVAARARWRRWAARRRANRACALVEYDGRALGRLIVAGWLPERDVYPPEAVSAAIAEMLDHAADLPRKK